MLVVCQHFFPESFRINDLCAGFTENDIEVDVLCGEPNYPQGEWFSGYNAWHPRTEVHEGIHIYRTFEIKRGNNSNVRIFLNYMTFPMASLLHVPQFLNKHYDRIFIYQLSPVYMAVAGITIGKLTHTPIIMYVMDLWPENLYSVLNFQNPAIRAMLLHSSNWCYQNTDKLICLTGKMRDILVKRTGKPDSDICVIPQCCEKIYEKPIFSPQLAKKFPDGFNLVFTGNLSPAQDFPLILKSATILKKEGYHINWIIVGDGMSRKEIQRQVQRRGLEQCFFFEGFHPIEDMPKYAGIADGLIACLSPSPLLDCTIPAKVMSYLASGKPIILAMDGEAKALINQNHCGFAGDSGNLPQLVANIKKLYHLTPEQRQKMGKQCHALHFRDFERNVNLKKMIKFIFE